MSRHFLFLLVALLAPALAWAQDDTDTSEDGPHDAGPPISIKSPDTATTFVFGTVKSHSLVWDKKAKVLIARITFEDETITNGMSNEDTHEFRLPGVSLDEAKGIFFAVSAKGEAIPVARYKKVLFLKTIETERNAIVRILRQKGNVSVVLEAISPNDPAMHAADASTNDTQSVTLPSLFR